MPQIAELQRIRQVLESHTAFTFTTELEEVLRDAIGIRQEALQVSTLAAYQDLLEAHISEADLLCLQIQQLQVDQAPTANTLDPQLELRLLRQVLKQRTDDLETSSKELSKLNDSLLQTNQELKDTNNLLLEVNKDLSTREAELRSSDERFRSSFSSAPLGMALAYLNGILFEVNDAFCDLLGYSTHELCGKSIQPHTDQENWNKLDEVQQEFAKGFMAQHRSEIKLRHRSGKEVYTQMSVSLARKANKEPDYIIYQVLDISTAKEAAEEHRRSEANYRELFNSFSEHIYITDQNGRFLEVNQSVYVDTGLSRNRIEQSTAHDLRSAADNDMRLWDQRIAAAWDGKPQRFEHWGSKNKQAALREVMIKKGKYFGEDALIISSRDISASYKIQQKLRERDLRFQDLGSNIPDMIFQLVLEHTGKISIPYVSHACENIFGLEPRHVTNDATALVGLIHPNDADQFHDSLVESSQSGANWHWEGRIITADGEEKWIRNTARPRTLDDSSTLWNGVMTDITEQNLSQQEIAEKQHLYRLVTENATDVVSLFDAKQELRYLSPSIESMLGFSVDEIRDIGIPTLIHPEDREYVRAEIQRTTANQVENSRYSCRMQQKGGAYIWVEVVAKRQYDNGGRIVQTIANLRDVNNQLVAESRLKKSEMLHRLLAENSKDLICLHNLDRSYVYISPSISELTGYQPEELIGTDPLTYIHPEDLKRFGRKVSGVIFGDHPTQVEYRFRRKDESYLWMSTSTIPVKDDGGGTIRFQSSSRDVSAQKQAEQNLIEAKEKAEQAVQAKQQFLSNMSHEIRTPMNAVVGLTHLLEQENPREDQLDHLKTLKFSAENLLMIINDILDYAKIEEGKVIFEEVNFNLDELLGNLFQSFLAKAKEKDISLRFEKNSKLPFHLVGDSGRLSQVLYNILGNAIKFTETGYVKLRIEEIEKGSGWIDLQFTVIDTGIGISEQKLDLIFDRFSQADSETNRKFGGTGLGLSITKRLLELQNSELRVKSKYGKGSKFYFVLRFKTVTSGNKLRSITKADNNEPIVYKSLRHIRLLLVEDNKVNQMVATKFLNKWDIKPDWAENGLEALKMVDENRYDIILMDLQMPKMDGYEATREIRKTDADIPIIALTASAMADTRDRVLRIGMTDYISKPFSPADLYLKLMKFARKELPNTE